MAEIALKTSRKKDKTACVNALAEAKCKKTKVMRLKDFCMEIFKVGLIGFGGGNALVPVMEDAFVKNESFSEDQETYDKDVLVANLTPGALPIELASALGGHGFGMAGMILGPLFFALPGIVMAAVLFILLSLVSQQTLNYINMAAVGVAGFIIALLLDYIVKVFAKNKQISKKRYVRTYLVVGLVFFFTCGSSLFNLLGLEFSSVFSVSTVHVLVVVFFAAFWMRHYRDAFHVGSTLLLGLLYLLGHGKAELLSALPGLLEAVSLVMLALALVGLARSVKGTKKDIVIEKKKMAKTFLFWLLFMVVLSLPALVILKDGAIFLLRDIVSTFISFGGGDAYLTIADGMFVETGHISSDVFYSQVITVVNVLPGSILCKTLFGIGYYMGYQLTGVAALGVLTGISAFACSVAASCMAFYLVYYLYESVSQLSAIDFIGRWIRPIVCGLLLKVMISLASSSSSLAYGQANIRGAILLLLAVLAAANYLIKKRFSLNPWLMVIIDISIALTFFALVL